MSKKQNNPETGPARMRRQLKQEQEDAAAKRRIYMWVAGIVGLIAAILIIGFVVVGFIQPQQPVATINGKEISMGDWQDQVRYQRAQIISNLEQFLENANGDVGLIQQLLGQQLTLMLPGEEDTLGALVLDNMIEDQLIRDEAELRGIFVSEADVQARIGENYNYFPNGTPTPLPTATASPQPTASLTPIPTQVITEVVPTATPFPTLEPQPSRTPGATATLVSADSFQEQYAETLADLEQYGASQTLFEKGVESQLLREQLEEALAEEAGYDTEELQASLFILTYDDEAGANAGMGQIEADGFITIWNKVKSVPFDSENPAPGRAQEQLWLSQSQVGSFLGVAAAEAAFDLPLGEPSQVLTQTVAAATEDGEETTAYHILMVSGREIRPLTQGAIDQQKQEILTAWLEEQRNANVEQFESRWQDRSPSQPSLDPKFFQPPTPDPNALPAENLP